MHTVTVKEISPALNTEIILAASSNSKTSEHKSLSYTPHYKGSRTYSVVFLKSKSEKRNLKNSSCFKTIAEAVDFYNTINI